MNLQYGRNEDQLIVKICGEIDHHSAKSAREEIDDKFKSEGCKNMILDMSGITFCDSSGLGLIMGRYKTVTEEGGELYVQRPSPSVDKMIRLSGMDRLVGIIE